MSDYPLFPSENGPSPLIDHVGKRDVPKDRADDDVRSAMRSVAAAENKRNLASDLGLEGASTIEQWNRRIEEIGPNAAIEAAQLYARAPRVSAPQEEDRNEDDHSRSVRAAYRQAAARAAREEHLPAAVSALNRIEQKHGSLDILDRFKSWDQQLRQNPADAAPRIATEIANHVNEGIGMQSAAQAVNAYQAQHTISPEERAVMQRVLSSGEVYNLEGAHAYARYATAADIKDSIERDIVASQRQLEGAEMYFARLTVADWDRRHPNVSKGTREKMRALLSDRKAQTLEEAYSMVRR